MLMSASCFMHFAALLRLESNVSGEESNFTDSRIYFCSRFILQL